MTEVPGWTGLRDGRPSTTPWQLRTDLRGPTPGGQDGDVPEGPRALLVRHRRQSKIGEKRLGEQGVPGPAALQPHGVWKRRPLSQPGAPGALSLLQAKPKGEGPTSQWQLVGSPVSLSSPVPPADPEINQKIKSVTLVFCTRAPHRVIHLFFLTGCIWLKKAVTAEGQTRPRRLSSLPRILAHRGPGQSGSASQRGRCVLTTPGSVSGGGWCTAPGWAGRGDGPRPRIWGPTEEQTPERVSERQDGDQSGPGLSISTMSPMTCGRFSAEGVKIRDGACHGSPDPPASPKQAARAPGGIRTSQASLSVSPAGLLAEPWPSSFTIWWMKARKKTSVRLTIPETLQLLGSRPSGPSSVSSLV